MIELAKLCDDDRPSLAEPFSFKLDGQWWNAATNGHALLAIREGEGELERKDSPPAEQLFHSKPSTHRVSFDALATWLNESKPVKECDACNGAGSEDHECDCDRCEYSGEEDCEDCDGDGTVPNVEPFSFENVEFDRVILARFVEPVIDEPGAVTLYKGGEHDPLEFRADGWRLVFMPRAHGADLAPEMPAGLFEVL